MIQKIATCTAAIFLGLSAVTAAMAQQGGIDNTALDSAQFRPHERTFGLVYTLPVEVNATLQATIGGPMK